MSTTLKPGGEPLVIGADGLVEIPEEVVGRLVVAALKGTLTTVLYRQVRDSGGSHLRCVGWWNGFSRNLPYVQEARKEGRGVYHVDVERAVDDRTEIVFKFDFVVTKDDEIAPPPATDL